MHQTDALSDLALTGSIPYSPEEVLNLRGSNKLSARQAFYERKKVSKGDHFIKFSDLLEKTH